MQLQKGVLIMIYVDYDNKWLPAQNLIVSTYREIHIYTHFYF